MIRLSIIIPFFNVAPYIERCARSLMLQSLYEGMEFLFIDDCSTDDSLSVLEGVIGQYPQRIAQVRVIRLKEHQGVAAARTLGIQQAQGEYIGWCDADDWVEAEMYQTMLEKAKEEDADVVVCDFSHDTDDTIEYCQVSYPANGLDFITNFYKRNTTIIFLWNKIFRRALFIEHSIYPYEDINISEDINLALRYFFFANRISVLHAYFYHHDNTPHNSMSRCDRNYFFSKNLENARRMSEFLGSQASHDFYRTIHFIQFMDKVNASSIFSDQREYFQTFQECHSDVICFSAFPLSVRLKWLIIFSCYPCYRLYRWLKH